jgi:hypothetical protein
VVVVLSSAMPTALEDEIGSGALLRSRHWDGGAPAELATQKLATRTAGNGYAPA